EGVRDLLATVLHEVRTPLACLTATAEVLADSFEELGPRDARAMLRRLQRSATWLQALVDNLTAAAQLEAGAAAPGGGAGGPGGVRGDGAGAGGAAARAGRAGGGGGGRGAGGLGGRAARGAGAGEPADEREQVRGGRRAHPGGAGPIAGAGDGGG